MSPPVKPVTDTDSPQASPPRRRLSDKIFEAIQWAIRQGRRDIASRLTLIYDATLEEDARYARGRRRGDG